MERKVDYVPGEERDGFYVQPLMKRIWAVQLDILKIVNDICKRHKIKYFGWYGTLLGAVRHHGFIPWDDDMDLAMLREDYEKFIHYFEKEQPKGWQIFKVNPTLIHVLNADAIKLDQKFLDNFHGCPYVIGVDVFCLDHIPANKEEEELWLELFSLVINLYTHWDRFKEDPLWEEGKWEQLKDIENLTGYHFDKRKPIKEQLYTLTDNIAAMYWDAKSEEVAIISSLHKNKNYRIPRSYFDNIAEVPFENTTMPILADYDLPCRLSYGTTYMTPIKSSGHGGIRTQIETLRKHFENQGQKMPEFFDMDFDD